MTETLRHRAAARLPRPVREPLQAVWRRLYWWNAQRLRPRETRATIARLVASGNAIQLELGAAPRPEIKGWTSVDLNPAADIHHDLREPLPFPDNSVDEIYSSHMLEHFVYPEPMLSLLRDCNRMLKPGGRIRIAVPNARLFLNAYFNPEDFDRERFCGWEVGLHYTSRIDVVNFIAYLGGEHRFMFDDDNLPRVLAEAGFHEARMREFDGSIDIERRRDESIYAEARK
jgi:predicted SAM-dependent methyltransferase